MKNNNKGFTLIELVICMVIFGVVVASAFGFMLAGSRSYNTVTNRLNLELQSELAMNQLGEYIIDCNAGLYYKSETLYVINKGSNDNQYDVNVFKFTGDRINYGYGENAATLSNGTFIFREVIAADLLAENVTSFSVSPISSDGANVTSAEVAIAFARNSATCSGNKTIALRNKPAISIVQTS